MNKTVPLKGLSALETKKKTCILFFSLLRRGIMEPSISERASFFFLRPHLFVMRVSCCFKNSNHLCILNRTSRRHVCRRLVFLYFVCFPSVENQHCAQKEFFFSRFYTCAESRRLLEMNTRFISEV